MATKLTDKSNVEIAAETVDSWQDLFDFPPIDHYDKERMKRSVESALTTAQSRLAKEVLANLPNWWSYFQVTARLRLRDLFSRLGISVDEGAE